MTTEKIFDEIRQHYHDTIVKYEALLEQERNRKEAMLDYYRDLPDRDLDVYSKLVELAYKRDDNKGGKK